LSRLFFDVKIGADPRRLHPFDFAFEVPLFNNDGDYQWEYIPLECETSQNNTATCPILHWDWWEHRVCGKGEWVRRGTFRWGRGISEIAWRWKEEKKVCSEIDWHWDYQSLSSL